MRNDLRWCQTPYRPMLFETGDPYICRLAPNKHGIIIEWLPSDDGAVYTVYLKKTCDEKFIPAGKTTACRFELRGLLEETDYDLYVAHKAGQSRVRKLRTGETFGTVVNYLHPQDDAYAFSGNYLCSPSLVRLQSGALIASMDVFASGKPQNLTMIFRSDDDGKSWRYMCELFPCFWAKLFEHRGVLYALSATTEYGDLQIGKSTDDGNSFSDPVLLLRGSSGKGGEIGVHKNPQPVIEHGGRLWNTLEYGSWGKGFHASMVMSCNADSDLMNAENWSFSEPLRYDPDWEGTASGKSVGTIEGCLAVCPDGKLRNFMRYEMGSCQPNYGRILSFLVDDKHPTAPLRYDGAIDFPANHSKFEIKFDEKTQTYLCIASYIRGAEHAKDRNLLSLMISRDLKHWERACDLIDMTKCDPKLVGIQYVDFLIEGEDLLLLCRTAINGAHSFHDSNYLIFLRVQDFRKRITKGGSL